MTEERLKQLEARIEQVETQNEQLRDEITTDGRGFTSTRRQVLGALAAGGIAAGTLSGSASAAPVEWEESDGDDLLESDFDGIDVSTVQAGTVDATNARFRNPAIGPNFVSQQEHAVQNRPFAVTNKTELLAPSDSTFTNEILYWPSVIKADEVFSSPLGTYYMYYSPSHTSSAIGLAYADDPLGPWTDYSSNPVFDDASSNQTETPQAVWNYETDELFLYYHGNLGTSQSTALAKSTDGTSFTKFGIVIDEQPNTPGGGHTGYARPQRFGRDWVTYHLMGGGGSGRFGVSYSTDGENWHTDPRPLVSASDVAGGNDLRIEWNNSSVFRYNGSLWWLGTIAPFVSGAQLGDKKVAMAPLTSARRLARNPRILIEPTAGWEGDATATPCFFRDDGRLFVYYSSDGKIGAVEIKGGAF